MRYTFPQLDDQRKRIGAPLPNLTFQTTLKPIEKIRGELEKGGIEVFPEEIVLGPGGLLTYEGEQILLHIRREERKFHLINCNTLEEMRSKGLFEKYVVASRTDGLFLIYRINWITGEEEKDWVPLKVCKNCLRMINWRGYAYNSVLEKNKIYTEFDIGDFFAEYATFFPFLPNHRDTDPLDDYAEEWPRISMRYRKSQNWTCENCKVNLRHHRNLLHCHHKNRNRSDNREKNLQALCLLCHSEQPFHDHLKKLVTHRKRTLIEKLRREQGLSS